jgi:exopolyphosphatase/pppGpp-phosphohydrolase
MGTNSWKLLLASVSKDGRHTVLAEDKETVKLLSGSRFNTIEPEARDRALRALERFTSTAAQEHADIVAVATAGVRAARNSRGFLDTIALKVSRCRQPRSALCLH